MCIELQLNNSALYKAKGSEGNIGITEKKKIPDTFEDCHTGS